MAGLSFAFDGNKNATPESRKRIADAMMGAQSMPQDIGQGLGALGQALMQRQQARGPFPDAPGGASTFNLANLFGVNKGGLY